MMATVRVKVKDELSESDISRYKASAHGNCPFCGYWDTEGSSWDSDGNEVCQERQCLACNAAWLDTYLLTYVEIIEFPTEVEVEYEEAE